MSNITLIMTRSPLEEVNRYGHNGRWGRMLVVRGAKVLSGSFSGGDAAGVFFALFGGFGSLFQVPIIPNRDAMGRPSFLIGHKNVSLETEGGGNLEVLARFDTLERFRTDKNKSKFYVQLKPRPEKPYEIRMDTSKNVRETVNKSGQCFRVHGHDTKTGGGYNAGILLHEASHPGWLTGCIAPREINNRVSSDDFGPSRRAMETIFQLMAGFSSGKRADLLVMDW